MQLSRDLHEATVGCIPACFSPLDLPITSSLLHLERPAPEFWLVCEHPHPHGLRDHRPLLSSWCGQHQDLTIGVFLCKAVLDTPM